MDAPVLVFGGLGQVGQAVVRAGFHRNVIGLGRHACYPGWVLSILTDEPRFEELMRRVDEHIPSQ